MAQVSGDEFLAACKGEQCLPRYVDPAERASTLATVIRFLDAGGDVEQRHSQYPNSRSGLQQAAITNRLDVIQILLDRGADPNRRLRPQTALMQACSSLSMEAANLLLRHGADPNLQSLDGKAPLACIVSTTHRLHSETAPFVKLLIDAGAEVRGPFGEMAVLTACEAGNALALQHLLAAGAPPDNRPPKRQAPLFAACHRGSASCVKLLLDHGADPNAVGLVEEYPDDSNQEYSSDEVADPELFQASSLYAACFWQESQSRFSSLPREIMLATENAVKISRLLLQSCARIDSLTFGHLCLRAPRQNAVGGGTVPSNAKPLQKLFLKYYTILVRLHAIGTPSSRRAPDRWRLAARDVAPVIASFLSPAPPRAALAFWELNGEEYEFTDNPMFM